MTATDGTDDLDALARIAADLDDSDPLAAFVDEFEPADGVVSYLDGNSLGRPVRGTGERIADFVANDWGTRLIRSWDEGWMELPYALGDRIGRITLGAAPGRTVVADSTTVLLYKLISAAVQDAPAGSRILIERGNFPTDRFLVEGIAAHRGLVIDWVDPDPIAGVTGDDVTAALTPDTVLVVLSNVDYRSGALADLPAITRAVHDAGALILWDLCHSAGVVPMTLDASGVDLAVGCTYKYLNGGPGSPAFAYVRAGLQERLEQPIWGWMGAADVFAMAPEYRPGTGMRRFLSGTPPVVGMLAMQGMLDLIERAGMDAVRAKSIALTEFAIRAYDALLAPAGVELLTTRDSEHRGSHITIGHPSFREVTAQLWTEGVVPDFRAPQGIRLGLSPLSTTFAETLRGVTAVAAALPR
ncbi:kynureninase [Labedella gwakjiensis]|uniref:Kynureninase n=1 Tax=Labedella gwakjiensis TaxID=390269 RepID=A0A2P8GVI4_9MICO|nr:aminotransferase class V-fold PLP-dependent enzyme [Labedella gwakjiensis]PSL37980.1 kynureninase [Labedella gwakjiensis]RUQ87455.1 aminotransferase class V-fold PLP-dependent enzyme [Labedella gwakjiensis]